MAIGQWLVDEQIIEKGEETSPAYIVQAACAAHDIGNPPFGHSGENAIEGNAQGFRIIARMEMYRNDGGKRLSKAVLGSFMKYPPKRSDQGGSFGRRLHRRWILRRKEIWSFQF